MNIYKRILGISILSIMIVGCSHKDINNGISEQTPIVEESSEQNNEETSLETESSYTHDAGYTELIHGGFSMKFQELMEAIYSRVNYSMMGIAQEDVKPMDESIMTGIEDMMGSLNPIQDGEILGVVKSARELFDKTNAIITNKEYEELEALNEEGQNLYNAYYEWLIEAANNHDHEH